MEIDEDVEELGGADNEANDFAFLVEVAVAGWDGHSFVFWRARTMSSSVILERTPGNIVKNVRTYFGEARGNQPSSLGSGAHPHGVDNGARQWRISGSASGGDFIIASEISKECAIMTAICVIAGESATLFVNFEIAK